MALEERLSCVDTFAGSDALWGIPHGLEMIACFADLKEFFLQRVS